MTSRLLVFLIVSLAGCAQTATIRTLDSGTIEAKLLSSDAQTLRVQTSYSVIDIRRDRVTDIDHPGNPLIVTGLSIAGVGVMQTVIGFILLATDEPIDFVTGQIGGGVIFMAAGSVIGWSGYKRWRRSKRALEPTGHTVPLRSDSAEPSLVLRPAIAPTREGIRASIVLGFDF